jgi:hypothetical protein
VKIPQGLLKLKERTERFLRDFEWTWTKAVVFSLGLSFFCVISMAVIPSFWLYFAEQTLGWDGLSGTSDWRLQNWRRKLRGAAGDRPSGGYR